MKDNKGFSLVELVIVLAIIAALSGTIFYSFSLMTGQYARECANNISTALEKEKNYALTRSASVDCYMEIVKDGNSYVARYYVPESAIAIGGAPPSYDSNGNGADWLFVEEYKIGKSRVNLTYKIGEDGSEVAIDDNPDHPESVKFVYDRISGALKAVVGSDGSEPDKAGGTRRGGISLDGDSEVYNFNEDANRGKKVIIASSYGRRYEIEIFTATGKHVVSRK